MSDLSEVIAASAQRVGRFMFLLGVALAIVQ